MLPFELFTLLDDTAHFDFHHLDQVLDKWSRIDRKSQRKLCPCLLRRADEYEDAFTDEVSSATVTWIRSVCRARRVGGSDPIPPIADRPNQVEEGPSPEEKRNVPFVLEPEGMRKAQRTRVVPLENSDSEEEVPVLATGDTGLAAKKVRSDSDTSSCCALAASLSVVLSLFVLITF